MVRVKGGRVFLEYGRDRAMAAAARSHRTGESQIARHAVSIVPLLDQFEHFQPDAAATVGANRAGRLRGGNGGAGSGRRVA